MEAGRTPGWAAGYAERLVEWIREQVARAGAAGTVVASSGGVDSAVTAGLCQRAFPGAALALFLPCHSDPQDGECARIVAEALGLEQKTIVLDGAYDALVSALGASAWSRLALGNLKVRLRTIVAYAHANQMNRLVVGTSNRSEITVGYFTKYGDGACDIAPLGRLVKREVRELARELGVPERVVERVPSAGLWPGQTDEGELGLTYAELDAYLRGEVVRPEVAARIESLRRASEHKRRPPAVPDF
ncbi:MAG: NAD(+) synthase [Acetobacteraceae bacterium]|nr:NAD(+) synthase [Acetobacteraceae bacterium]